METDCRRLHRVTTRDQSAQAKPHCVRSGRERRRVHVAAGDSSLQLHATFQNGRLQQQTTYHARGSQLYFPQQVRTKNLNLTIYSTVVIFS